MSDPDHQDSNSLSPGLGERARVRGCEGTGAFPVKSGNASPLTPTLSPLPRGEGVFFETPIVNGDR